MSERAFQKRAVLLCAGLVTGFSLLSVRLVYLQVVMHEKYAAEALAKHTRKEVLYSRRGNILDRNGELLARNQTVYNVIADKHHLCNFDIACRGLAVAESIGSQEVRRKYDRGEIVARYRTRVVRVLAHPLEYHGWELRQKLDNPAQQTIILRRNIDEEQYCALKELISRERLGGIYFEQTTRRFYPSPRTLTHVLGHVNYDGMTEAEIDEIVGDRQTARILSRQEITRIRGKEGVEKAMEDVLRGEIGYRNTESDRRGREITAYRGETKQPRHGHHVRLTVDMGLQNIVEAALTDAWYEFMPEKISAVFMNPNTGEILALANRPHFDLSSREGELRNRALSDNYEPGSTFKIVTLAAVLDRQLVNRKTPIYCHLGSYQDGALRVSDHHPYGQLTVEEVLAKSSNIGTYKLAMQLGKKSFHEYMLKFGFGSYTGLELTGESPGRVYNPKVWSLPSFSRMSIGYEVAVTPVQMANALAVIANGGQLLKPRILDAILDEKGRVIRQYTTEEVRRVISERAASEVRKMLIKVVSSDGTGEKGAVKGFTVAGKTGTARKYSPAHHRYLDGRYVVSFMGFLPAENPQLLGIVMVDDPQTGSLLRYGGTIAAPIFSRIATEAAAYLDLDPNFARPDYAGRYPTE